jgi:hypothetical protein
MIDAFGHTLSEGDRVLYSTKNSYGTVYVVGTITELIPAKAHNMARVIINPDKASVASLLPFSKHPSVYAINCVLLEKQQEAQSIIQEWVNKQSHDKCWYYPDLFRKLADLFKIKAPDPGLPSEDEFKSGCEHYRKEVYHEQQT